MGWQMLCSLDAGAKVNDDDDAHLYCEESELMIFYKNDENGQQKEGTIQPSAPLEEEENENGLGHQNSEELSK
jgi:hypothetical protein